MVSPTHASWPAALVAALVLTGCSGSPPRVTAPSWDPAEVAGRAMDLLDANGDAAIDTSEAAASPGFEAAFSRLDKDQDDRVTSDELQQRIAFYRKMKTGLISRSFTVLVNGKPAAGARVEFAPEAFVQDVTQPATGVTDRAGVVCPETVGKDLPAMQVGFYRVDLYASESATEPLTPKRLVGVEVSPVAEVDDEEASILRFEK